MIRSIIMARRGLGLLAVGALVVLLGADEGDCTGSPQINNTVNVCVSADGGGRCGNEARANANGAYVSEESPFAVLNTLTPVNIAAARQVALQMDAALSATPAAEHFEEPVELEDGLAVLPWQPAPEAESQPFCFCEVVE